MQTLQGAAQSGLKTKAPGARRRLMAAALMIAGLLLFLFSGSGAKGALSHHMVSHIALMNLIAPGIILCLSGYARRWTPPGVGALWAAAFVQLILFLFWHAPPLLAAAPVETALMHLSLFLAALWFWGEIISRGADRPLTSIAALAVTGKIICLVAALYVFAPRAIYASTGQAPMADQQLAGLIMLAACPLAYLGAAMRIAVIWLDRLHQRNANASAA